MFNTHTQTLKSVMDELSDSVLIVICVCFFVLNVIHCFECYLLLLTYLNFNILKGWATCGILSSAIASYSASMYFLL
jgi:hypothetical protein